MERICIGPPTDGATSACALQRPELAGRVHDDRHVALCNARRRNDVAVGLHALHRRDGNGGDDERDAQHACERPAETLAIRFCHGVISPAESDPSAPRARRAARLRARRAVPARAAQSARAARPSRRARAARTPPSGRSFSKTARAGISTASATRSTATRTVVFMPGRSRGSIWSSSHDHVEVALRRPVGKIDARERADVARSCPTSSLSGTASARTTTRWPGCMRPRSASSSRAVTRSVDRSGTSAMICPGHARSPDLKSGGGQHERQFGMMATTPSTGATISRPPSCRSRVLHVEARLVALLRSCWPTSAFSMSPSAFSFRSASPSLAFASLSASSSARAPCAAEIRCGTASSSARRTS